MNVLRGWVLFYLMHRVRDHSQTTFTTRGSYIGGPMMFTFCQCSHHRKCQCKGVGGQKKNLSNTVCDIALTKGQEVSEGNWGVLNFSKKTQQSIFLIPA